jgi:cytochrome P450
MVNMQGVHHNPEFWPSPMDYRPERFKPENDIKPYTFLPFVEGPRNCLGQYLSLLESKIVLSILVSKYKFRIVDKDLAGVKHPTMIPIIPKNGHYMYID